MATFCHPHAVSAPPAFNALEPDYAARLGPLAPILADPHVTEVMVVAGRDIYVEVEGRFAQVLLGEDAAKALARTEPFEIGQ